MVNYNKLILTGNLTKDPEAKTEDLTIVSIAVNDSKDRASFFDIRFWGKSAELARNYLKKGRAILVEGSIRQSLWKDKDGNKRNSIEIEGREFIFLDKNHKENIQPINKFSSPL